MCAQWHSWPTLELASEACARWIAQKLESALSIRGHASVAISGGTTPRLLFECLAVMRLGWPHIHVFWVDERLVLPCDPESNFRLAYETLIGPAGIPPANVHRVRGELSPDEAVRRYVGDVRRFFKLGRGELPRFDVMHCGIGADTHTASLFPGDPRIHDRTGIAATVYVPKLSQWRVTLLPGPIVNAAHTAVLAAGNDKAEAVRSVFTEQYAPIRYPAQLNCRLSAFWFLDAAAARFLRQ